MPDNEAPIQAFYDHETDEPRATGRRRRQVADWGVGEDVFDRLPSRRFTRGDHGHARRDERAATADEGAAPRRAELESPRPRRRRPAADWLAEVSPRAETRTIVIGGDAPDDDESRRTIVLEGDLPEQDAPRRAIVVQGDVPASYEPGRAIVVEGDAGELDERGWEIASEGDGRELARSRGTMAADEVRRAMVIDGDIPDIDEPRRATADETRRAAADAPRARRTIVIGGHPDKLPAPRPRRPPRTALERVGASPDRIAAYAVGLGLLLILIAVLTTGH